MQTTLFSATLGEDGKVEPPLGPLYIAAMLRRHGWQVDLRDYQLVAGANAFDPDRMIAGLENHADVLMISCFVDMLPVVLAAAGQIKAARPQTIIMLGGPGPTAGAAELISAFPQIDAIVMGEGEETVAEWSAAFAAGRWPDAAEPIEGMAYRAGGQVVEGGPRPRILSASSIPRPAYDLIDWSHYTAARITTTRGCPYHCSFCDVAPLWGRKAIYRDLEDTVDEMVELRDRYGNAGLAIVDDTFVLKRDRVRAFCELLLSRGAGLQWGCFGRINLMSEDLIALMAKAGCRAIFYGVDSGSPAVLKRTFKELNAAAIVPTLEISARYFDRIEASFIWGYPFETLEDFRCTLEIAAEASRLAPRVNVQMHMLSPLPSSPLYKEFQGELLRPEPEDLDWLLLPALLLDPRGRQVRAVIERAPHLFPGFFTYPTPAKAEKRDLLRQAMRAIDSLMGLSLLDDEIYGLLHADDDALERRILAGAASPTDRIGFGLALGLFRRTRRRRDAGPAADDSRRGAGMVRVRNDSGMMIQ